MGRRVVKSIEELKELCQHEPVINIYEEEEFFWIELKAERGTYLKKVLKALSFEKALNLMEEWGFPRRILKNLQNTQKTEELKMVLKAKDGALLTGPAGTGKTHAACYTVAKNLMRREINCACYISAVDLFDYTEMKEARERVHDSKMILLDDVNAFMTEPQKNFVKEIIYHCYNEEKGLLLTSNLTRNDLFRLLADEPILSRLSTIKHIKFKGKDRRLRHEVPDGEGSSQTL